MARIDRFEIVLRTGEKGRSDIPDFKINGFQVPLESIEGGCGPNETLKAMGAPQSVAHSLLLAGPSESEWDVEGFKVTFLYGSSEKHTARFGQITVPNDADLDILAEKPLPVFDV